MSTRLGRGGSRYPRRLSATEARVENEVDRGGEQLRDRAAALGAPALFTGGRGVLGAAQRAAFQADRIGCVIAARGHLAMVECQLHDFAREPGANAERRPPPWRTGIARCLRSTVSSVRTLAGRDVDCPR